MIFEKEIPIMVQISIGQETVSQLYQRRAYGITQKTQELDGFFLSDICRSVDKQWRFLVERQDGRGSVSPIHV